MLDDDGVNFFVYGTLKLGQCRQGCWPFEPIRVVTAWTFGRLYDVGPYPAMIKGDDRVAGEVWTFTKQQAAAVLRTLDAVEVTNQPGQENLFDRLEATVYLEGSDPVTAFLYTYADVEALDKFGKPVRPQSRLLKVGVDATSGRSQDGEQDGGKWASWPIE